MIHESVESGEGIESAFRDPEKQRIMAWNPVKELKDHKRF